ncbi:spore cortex-lytic enzyme [Brevibacillus sp. CF112]|uniref:spore cortex-lytic enzyme n=1 Tax=Brevibacillus TaxID=55080 RepID=UPI000271D500|nr:MULTISPECIES: spore cortex-lytic enzyme [Brevibacillus]ELK39659.1 spore cortex-lytic enzyme precursor [Brevibacillus agri BAB-2500]EJL41955.1 spore cortex-lytic enzyme [Brevibacillus sp. CF112]MBY0053366.1 spore cortex-lytic enzyme [Brevibacillus agri]MDR9506711.1 spore cortex-lytic enzyme [Brevibacillus agri]MED3497697.1 spore cortex-lytic enzyme [Brevibacillus agri]
MSWMKKTLTTLLSAMLAVAFVCPAESFAAPLLKRGSESGDVWDLQYRLQLLGYYTDRLDGSYGANTVQAVKKFQKAYGLPVDGVAGTNTWRALKKVSVNRNEMQMLAQLVYSEARGESFTGQVAVAAVALNRLKSKDFPNTLKGVIFEPYAFTAVIDGQYWLSPNKTAYRAAWEAVRGWDPTNGALYYFNPSTATSKWIWSRPQVVKIGKHIFAK